MNLLITGGAGFIGSHLLDHLYEQGHTLLCLDDLSLGSLKNIEHLLGKERFSFENFNINDFERLTQLFQTHTFDAVFHMAANSDIQAGGRDLNVDYEKTFMTTFNLLKCIKEAKITQFIFASTSAIYGEITDTGIYEDIGPLFPVSFYGAAKLASEAYISACCTNFGLKAWIYRFPNVVGERLTHGAVYDFVGRLLQDPKTLRILGDGSQTKPYLYVKDLIDGIMFGWKNAKESLNYFNLGVQSATTVTRIAEIIVEEMNLRDVRFDYTGGTRGWVGDVPKFQYDLSKIHALGWRANRTSDEAVRLCVRKELELRNYSLQ